MLLRYFFYLYNEGFMYLLQINITNMIAFNNYYVYISIILLRLKKKGKRERENIR